MDSITAVVILVIALIIRDMHKTSLEYREPPKDESEKVRRTGTIVHVPTPPIGGSIYDRPDHDE